MQSSPCLRVIAALAFVALTSFSQQAPASASKIGPPATTKTSDSNTGINNVPHLSQALPGVASPNNRTAANGSYRPIPDEIVAVLLSLPTDSLQVPRPLLKHLLEKESSYVVEIPHGTSPSDYRITSTGQSGAAYFLWVRVFQGVSPGVVGYLALVSASCKELEQLPSDTTMDATRHQCAQPGNRRLGGGLRAYRIANGQAEDVTTSIRQPIDTLGPELYKRYRAAGASEAFLDASRLDQAPVGRWIMELDPEQPLAEDAPRAFDRGMLVHAGFFLWNGDHFENRDTVPTSLWPCTDRPSECIKEDRYVTADK
ncbi:hypothetical protein [Xanthomonas campestris]|uniref:hypothetical protein n=1 Tax=Xanthomonas campestris TaxID=339 RepID=UPI002B236D3C|nr:hypothetical protein [Xanthomonas campestris]MEA9659949.1 hypothetical protein [Xanthomonas campestris pv. raphani]MEA9765526.1 hypothetical protein [Xanthomonas campestris pv. raphani]MEA9817885.1 hypothetical protein [Xanthomonas campestris pv. raphani]MEA9911039.1 hypothetical protein [Xanthomonas campestris pv. raphani]MEA9927308.1 hypothetical protein [Xanthomonas campestris pv. raphani]